MNSELDLMFLGRLFPFVNEEKVRSKARVDMQDAANQLQWNLIKGLAENGVKEIKVTSFLPIDSWPKHFEEAYVKPINNNVNGIKFKSVGFCNITYIKQILCKKVCNREIVKWARTPSGRKKVLLCYTCNNTLMRAVAAAKKVNPNILTVQVIADITEFAANDDAKGVKKFFTKKEIKTNNKLKKYVDKYVLLTEQMKDKLCIDKPYIVMEGIAPQREKREIVFEKRESKTILYTGSMNKKYGICELLDSFMIIDEPDFKLVLCGLGNAEEEIMEAAKRDDRICFLGKVPHNKTIELQKKADVLVNPRHNNEEFTKYSFPSKNLEYLSSGKPLVAFKLDGIPAEYDEYINYVEDDSLEAFRDKIIEVCLDENGVAAKRAAEASKFILENKGYKAQTKRILDFVLIGLQAMR